MSVRAAFSSLVEFFYYNMVYFKLCFYSTNLQCNPYSSRERLFLIKLDDCSILQRDHLVRNRPSPECMMGRATNEHLPWLDLGENLSTPSDLVTHIFDSTFPVIDL
jgi:hypothetical protein